MLGSFWVFHKGNKEGLHVLQFFALEKTRQTENKSYKLNKNIPYPKDKNKPDKSTRPTRVTVNYRKEKVFYNKTTRRSVNYKRI